MDDQHWKSEGSCLSRERAFGSDCVRGSIERGGSEFDNEKIIRCALTIQLEQTGATKPSSETASVGSRRL